MSQPTPRGPLPNRMPIHHEPAIFEQGAPGLRAFEDQLLVVAEVCTYFSYV